MICDFAQNTMLFVAALIAKPSVRFAVIYTTHDNQNKNIVEEKKKLELFVGVLHINIFFFSFFSNCV